MKSSFRWITPTLAQNYLATQARNRKVKQSHVIELATAMQDGKFLVSGDPIRFNRRGELIDGQHRLLACVRSGKGFDSLIVTDLDETVQDVLDTGLKRTQGDILGLEGYSSGHHLAATLRWLWRFDTQQYVAYQIKPQMSTLKATLEQHPSVKDSLVVGRSTQKLLIKSLGSALWVLFAEREFRAANLFFAQLASGEDLHEGNAILRLRKRLMLNMRGKSSLPYHEVAAITIKAFNAYRAGKKVRYLRWRTEGEEPEAFPTID